MLAGHWRPSGAGVNGPLNAAGQPSVISGETPSGTRSVVFGTTVMFRGHPKGGMSQAARAIFWAAPQGAKVTAPTASTVALSPVSPVTYPAAATVGVTTSGLSGTVQLLAGDKVVATGNSTAGSATLTVPGLLPGATQLVAKFTPAATTATPSVSAPATVTVAKAVSSLTLVAKKVLITGKKGKATLVITLSVPGVTTSGAVVLTDNGKVRKNPVLAAGSSKKIKLTLASGKHRIKVKYAGTALVLGDTAKLKIG